MSFGPTPLECDVWCADVWCALGLAPHDAEPVTAGSLEDLMTRYVDGDGRAFEALYSLSAPKLFGYLLRLTRDRTRAEDLVQTTFVKLHRARTSYLKGAPLLPWLLAIGRRSFLDERRRARVRPEDLSFDGQVPEPKSVPSNDVDRDRAEVLELALSKIPESYAEAIQLTKITGLSVAEAAEVLGATKTAVKLRVHRGYALLRKELTGTELGGDS